MKIENLPDSKNKRFFISFFCHAWEVWKFPFISQRFSIISTITKMIVSWPRCWQAFWCFQLQQAFLFFRIRIIDKIWDSPFVTKKNNVENIFFKDSELMEVVQNRTCFFVFSKVRLQERSRSLRSFHEIYWLLQDFSSNAYLTVSLGWPFPLIRIFFYWRVSLHLN